MRVSKEAAKQQIEKLQAEVELLRMKVRAYSAALAKHSVPCETCIYTSPDCMGDEVSCWRFNYEKYNRP